MGPLADGERWRVDQSDCLDWLRALPDGYLDLIFCSPPYEKARLYLENGEDMGIARDTESWVAWLVEVVRESVRACKGLCAFVVEGQTADYRWTAGPMLLAADLHRAGVCLRKPPIFHRVGIPGSGGNKNQHAEAGGSADWWRNDYEFILCATRGGKLPWADALACGHAPKWVPGGEMSHRLTDGSRKNAFGVMTDRPVGTRPKGDKAIRCDGETYRARAVVYKNGPPTNDTRLNVGSHRARRQAGYEYEPPAAANPGNVLKINVGGGAMGSSAAHDNEAPSPEALVEPFVACFAPPGGIVGDCFGGSGTTAAVAYRLNRRALSCDLRQSQVDIARKRLANVTAELWA